MGNTENELKKFSTATIILGVLAFSPFVFILFIRLLNFFGYYISPLVIISMCPFVAIGLPVIAYTETRLIWRYLGSKEDGKKLTAICYGVSVGGFLVPLIWIGFVWSYVVATFLG